jgi:hypothetical protein
MSGVAKLFLFIFVLLAIGSLADDIYIWQNSNGFPFSFAALGWIAKTYCPNQLQITIDALGTETFNKFLTPILKIPAFFLSIGLVVFVVVVDFINRMAKKVAPGRGKDRDQNIKFNKRVR